MIEFQKENTFLLIFLLLLLFLFLLSIYSYEKKYSVEMRIIKEEEYYGIVYIKASDLDKIFNKPMEFKNRLWKYEIINIEQQFYIDTEYKVLKLKIDFDQEYLKEENVLIINFKVKNTTVFEEVLEFIKKGISG